MPSTAKEPMLSYNVLRLLEGFKRPLRKEVLRILDEQISRGEADNITAKELKEAIGRAAEEYLSDWGMTLDMDMVAKSDRDIAAGRTTLLEDLVNEFRCKCA